MADVTFWGQYGRGAWIQEPVAVVDCPNAPRPRKGHGMISKPSQWMRRAGQVTPRVTKWLAWLAALWLVLAVSSYFLGPPLVKSLLAQQLGKALARDVSIQEIAINPLTLSLRVNGLSVKDRTGRDEQFGFSQLYINLSSFSLAQAGIVVDEIRLQAPRAHVTRLADGHFDISDLLDKWASSPDKGPSPLPRFSLNNIQISDGQLDLDDRSKGIRHTVSALQFNLPFISSLPYKADVFVKPSFSATVDGSEVSFKGQSKPFAPSHASELEIALNNLELSQFQPYLPATLPVRLKSGKLSTALRLGFTQQSDGVPSVQLSGSAQLQALALTEGSGTPFLDIDKLELDLQAADPLQGRWSIAQLEVQGLRAGQNPALPPLRVDKLLVEQAKLDLQARSLDAAQVQVTAAHAQILRTPRGELAWIALPQSSLSGGPETGKPGAPGAPDWVARVGRFSLQDAGLRFEDRSLSPPAVQTLEHVNLQAEKLDSTPGHSNAFSLAATVNQSGALKASGALQLLPLSLQLKLDTQTLPVSPLQGYINAYLVASRVQGQLSSKGELLIQQRQGALNARYKGALNLGQFGVTDTANNADFLKWKSLYVGAVDFQLEPMKLNIGEIALSDFYSRLILNKDGRLNLADMVRTSPAPVDGSQDKREAAATPPLPIQIAKVTLQNGNVNFSDQFVRPNYSANITRLGGSVLNLSSAADTVAELDLRGSYASNAPVQIAARLNPLAEKKFLDLKADISSIDLVDLSPYSGKYAGYKIDKGKLSLNASYKVENRQLTADNRIFIDQLTFGEKVESPDATQLPVHLAIALLKNNRGEIDIHLPISGSLDNPQFSMGGLIFKVIANLFVKAVTSPFALLGSLFGGQEELSQIAFAPGRASLDDAAIKKLDILAKAMREREGLTLEITGSADQDSDLEGLKQAALERAMQAEKRKDLRKPSESVSEQDLRIAPGEYATYLTRAYRQARFPKPRNLIGLAKELPVAEMEKLMLTHQAIEDEDLRALASARAQAAQAWLIEQGRLPLSRIFLLPTQLGKASGSPAETRRNRVDFSLR